LCKGGGGGKKKPGGTNSKRVLGGIPVLPSIVGVKKGNNKVWAPAASLGRFQKVEKKKKRGPLLCGSRLSRGKSFSFPGGKLIEGGGRGRGGGAGPPQKAQFFHFFRFPLPYIKKFSFKTQGGGKLVGVFPLLGRGGPGVQIFPGTLRGGELGKTFFPSFGGELDFKPCSGVFGGKITGWGPVVSYFSGGTGWKPGGGWGGHGHAKKKIRFADCFFYGLPKSSAGGEKPKVNFFG